MYLARPVLFDLSFNTFELSFYLANGNTVTATVEDRCAACQPYDLDMTTSLFSQLAPIAKGRINISWAFIG